MKGGVLVQFDAKQVFGGLVAASEAPVAEPVGVDAVQLARDVLLSEQEFRRAGSYLSGATAESEGRGVGLSDWAKGLGWGALAVASVTPFGTLGKLGRAVRVGEDVWDVGRVAEGVSGLGEAGVRGTGAVGDVVRPAGNVRIRSNEAERVEGLGEYWFRIPDPDSPGDTISLPGVGVGGRMGGRPMEISEVPDEIYHVTTNAPAVRSSGIINVSSGSDMGAGGTSGSGAVSFTVNRAVAETLKSDLQAFADLKNMRSNEQTVEMLLDVSRRQGMNEEGIAGLRASLQQFLAVNREFSPKDVFTAWDHARWRFGGPSASVIYGSPLSDYWRTVDPADVDIIAVSRNQIPEGALINDYDIGRGNLEEIQVYADVPLAGDVARGAGRVVAGSSEDVFGSGRRVLEEDVRPAQQLFYKNDINIDGESNFVAEQLEDNARRALNALEDGVGAWGILYRSSQERNWITSAAGRDDEVSRIIADYGNFVEEARGGVSLWDFSRSSKVGSRSGKYVVPINDDVFIDSASYSNYNRDLDVDRLGGVVYRDLAKQLLYGDKGAIIGFRSHDGVTDGYEARYVAGSLADSADEAFASAASRGKMYVYDAETGSKVRVPDRFYAEEPTYPGKPAPNIVASFANDATDGDATLTYAGRREEDLVLKEIYKAQGFDEPAELISMGQFYQLFDAGFIPLYRGIEMSVDSFIPNQTWVMQDISSKSRRRLGGEEVARRIGEVNARRGVNFSDITSLRFRADFKRWARWRSGLTPGQIPETSEILYFDRDLRYVYGDATVDEVISRFVTPEKYVEIFAKGEYWAGSGTHGSGTYMTPVIHRAQGYAGNRVGRSLNIPDYMSDNINGVVVGAALSPTAKIMGPNEYRELAKTIQTGDWQRMRIDNQRWNIPEELNGMFKPAERARLNEGLFSDDIQDAIELDILNEPAAEFNQMLDSLPAGLEALEIRPTYADMGRLIAALGYDGYLPYRSVYEYYKPEYVILNRKVLKVIDRPINPLAYDESGNRLGEVPIW